MSLSNLRWLEPVYIRVCYVFESRFSGETINLTDFYVFGILNKEWWNLKKIIFIFLLV